jgi:hypothetical protein
MSERQTPETDAAASPHIGFFSCATTTAAFARKLERERDEAREQNAKLRDIAERAIEEMESGDPVGTSDAYRAELDQLKEGAK